MSEIIINEAIMITHLNIFLCIRIAMQLMLFEADLNIK